MRSGWQRRCMGWSRQASTRRSGLEVADHRKVEAEMAFVSSGICAPGASAMRGAALVSGRGASAAIASATHRRAHVARVGGQVSRSLGSQLNMSISEGERISMNGKFGYMDASGNMQEISYEQLFGNKKVALFAVPGALTGTCTKAHAPGVVKVAADLKKAGIDEVVVTAVNDVFVMKYFADVVGAGDVMFLADGDASFAKSVGLTKDTGSFGGLRSLRYSMLVSNGVVVKKNVDLGGLDQSSGEVLLKQVTEAMDPLEKYCQDNEAADECRVYDN
ncbi:Peroxiredoxin-2C [Porphyridium purpureum]|uniref:Peroxiredoxin-2C n=1 Tax=Porphyridium purpureum TaxID=35688 RepID=A0A5J4Z0K9_PORPP|nr:Peroxiredoxin-2C [Porphyridium purpureum]|eukprot:POR1073..scf208_2